MLLLTLDKVKKTWWATVFVGDDEIDTQLVDSTCKISEYDEATQGAKCKIMFDQNQQRLGLPTSDQYWGNLLTLDLRYQPEWSILIPKLLRHCKNKANNVIKNRK